MKTIPFNFVLDTGDGDYYLLDAENEEAAKELITAAEDCYGFSYGNPVLVDKPDNYSAIYNALSKTKYASLGYKTKDELFDAYENDPDLRSCHAYSIDNVEAAIIGVSEDGSRFIYDYDLIIECLQTGEEMTEEDALEWYSYNIERSFSYYQPCPIVVHCLEQ